MLKVLLFRKRKGDIMSSAIAWITRGVYTHAAVLLDEQTGTIAEAFFPLVQIRQLGADELADIDVFEVTGLTTQEEQAARAYFHAHIGDRYSVEDLFRFMPLFRQVFGDDSLEAAAHHCFCSMFVFQGFLAAGVQLLARVEAWIVCPNLLSYSPALVPAKPLTLPQALVSGRKETNPTGSTPIPDQPAALLSPH